MNDAPPVTNTRAVPMLDLRAQLQRIRPEVDEAVERVIKERPSSSTVRNCGSREEFAAYCGRVTPARWRTARSADPGPAGYGVGPATRW